MYYEPQATSPGPVCPQRFPEIGDEGAALYRMPLARLRALQYLRPRLLRQSEDCLYLNLFVPRLGGNSRQPQQQQQRAKPARGEHAMPSTANLRCVQCRVKTLEMHRR